ncbi:MAG: hypothetical protein IE886_02195 [Campylobacterales bacterium]|nr:hypothetical protein [Campylobacterales bacterium]
MKRFAATLLTFAAIGASLYATEAAPELNSQYYDSSKCEACHATIVNE